MKFSLNIFRIAYGFFLNQKLLVKHYWPRVYISARTPVRSWHFFLCNHTNFAVILCDMSVVIVCRHNGESSWNFNTIILARIDLFDCSLTCFKTRCQKGCFLLFICGAFILYLFLIRFFKFLRKISLIWKMHSYNVYYVTIFIFDIKWGESAKLKFPPHFSSSVMPVVILMDHWGATQFAFLLWKWAQILKFPILGI